MNRTELMCSLLPPAPAGTRLLDACCPFSDPIVVAACKARGWRLTTCDLAPRKPDVIKVDLTKAETLTRLTPHYVVLSGDTLEHIEDYRSAIGNLVALTTDWLFINVPVPVAGKSSGLVRWLEAKTRRFTLERDPQEVAVGHIWSFGPLELMAEIESFGVTIIWHFTGHYALADLPRLNICCRKL